ncbi:MFS transporter [Citromicrobium bathyomarinum]|uniref:MFS transporter n=1 Tax=Sphingomonadales TaxID=204457 RepID=UPI000C50EAC0|nr:MFS transporter [Citromicrobium sp.]|tara:strand:+ start:13387 stop:15036 length:1650 start_codon:yes stop_codon:yes gene_type:complete
MSEIEKPAAAADAQVPNPDAPVPAYSWYALGVLVLVYVLNFVDRQILSILANDIKADLGVDDAFLGFLYGTAFAIFYSLFGIPLGKLADSWHRVRLMTIGLGLWSIMTALSGFAKNAAMLSGARVGVGIGEATASPSAYSLISDWFPARLRATALAIYSSGLYVGGGISLVIGGLIVENWNESFPDGGPLGLAGWQAAFIAVGLPGILLAVWVLTLKEPVRGLIDGMPSKPVERPFRGFFEELLQIIPPFTFVGAARRSAAALAFNVLGFAGFFFAAWLITSLVQSGQGFIMGAIAARVPFLDVAISDQWFLLAIGYYAIFSWASALRSRDAETFALTWGSPAFLCTILGYGTVAFLSYATSYWGAPYGERVFEISKSELGLLLGAPAAVTGFLGVVLGGRVADWLFTKMPAGRLYVVLFGLLAPIPVIWVMFTTEDRTVFLIMAALAQLFASSALGGAAATSQSLVLPRMRGVATATFFLATTLVGLALGPYLAGLVSAKAGEDLGLGMLSLLWIAPIGVVLLLFAFKLVPAAQERVLAMGQGGEVRA